MSIGKTDAREFNDEGVVTMKKESAAHKKNESVLGDFDFALHTCFLLAGRWLRGVLGFYDRIFSLNDDDLHVIHKNLATRYRNKGNLAKSIEYLEKTRKSESGPQKDKLTLALGELYFLNNNLEEAKSLYKEYLQQHPEEPQALVGLANIYSKENDSDSAIKYFEMATVHDTENHYAFYRLGTLYDKRKDYEQAVKYLKSAVALDPNSTRYNQHLGFVYETMGAHSEAIPYFKKVMELESEKSPNS